MRQKNKFSILIASAAAPILAAALMLGACAETPARVEMFHSNNEAAPPPVVPPANASSNRINESGSVKKVALILGPGSFKTFAQVGVIKELKKANIPIDAVVGVEWGALVGGLYSAHGQIHEVEWKMYKLEKVDLLSTGFFSRKRELKSMKAMSPFLAENLGDRDAGQNQVPFFCPAMSLSRGLTGLQKNGPLNKMVENCMASSPLLAPQNDVVADLFGYDEIIRTLRNSGFNVIIFVNVLGEGNLFDKIDPNEDYATAVLWDEARREVWRVKSLVTDVIDVPTQGLNLTDFESRKVLVTAGEAAGEKAAHGLLAKYGF
jgi:hypothetical protein